MQINLAHYAIAYFVGKAILVGIYGKIIVSEGLYMTLFWRLQQKKPWLHLFFIITAVALFLTTTGSVQARFDPLRVPNNRYGIHILEPNELDLAARLVNSSGGDWGYVSIVIRSDDRDKKKWQQFFNEARAKHVIPIVRIATKTQQDYWEAPTEHDAKQWAEFLSSLKWPTNNHYIIIYNEPNHAKEWGNRLDPEGYARELNKTIEAIRQADPNAFLLNAGFDAAAPNVENLYMDEAVFLEKMNNAVPGIFDKLDGWTSHSYPQPNFSGSPDDRGRNSIASYRWEQNVLKERFTQKPFPIFITETGWPNSDGVERNQSFLSEDDVANNFQKAFSEVWIDQNLVAVTPFTLTYQQKPFDHFSWFRAETFTKQVLGIEDIRPMRKQYFVVQKMPKAKGAPVQKNLAQLRIGSLPKNMGPSQLITVRIALENSGESLWFSDNRESVLQLQIASDKQHYTVPLFSQKPIHPGEIFHTKVDFLTPHKEGQYKFDVSIKSGSDETLASFPYHFAVENESPSSSLANRVIISIGKLIEAVKERAS